MIRRLVLISTVCVISLFAQEHATPAAGHTSEAGAAAHDAGDPFLMWKWINFAMLAAVLYVLGAKHLPAFFNGRNEEITKGIADARRMKAEADQRVAEVEQRLARMESEIESLRANARKEMEGEGERIRKETEGLIAKVKANAENEIEAITKNARLDLKNHSAKLALELAEQRIRGSVASADGGLVDTFIRDLERKGAQN